ncbi:MAG: oxidoreductase [Lachnospiraceae bacterium]|nr:oxidoreductase [Lachnospiraceae bacterium]
MKQIQTFTSTYTADVSGVPSALYELGGMTIMHDASGCNSTYNTHDEPRWYGSKSMVFITGLSEIEAIMGDDQKLVDDIVDAAKKLKPRFIAIAGTPIPMITGCDIEANARVIELETGIKTLGINTNGMHSYVEGAGEALLQYAKRFTKKMPKKEKSVNILGATPIDFSVNGQIESIEKFLRDNGFDVVSNFALSCDVEKIANAGMASVNLVISSVGIKLAEYFKKEFNTPYVVAVPYGKELKKEILKALNNDKCEFVSDLKDKFKNEKIYIIGESVTSKSLAKAIYYKYGHTPVVISGVELGNTYHGDIVKDMSVRENVALEKQDYFAEDEDEIEKIIKDAKMVIADPLYKPIVPKKAIFVNHPHEGFSGRLFRKDIINLIDKF